MGGLALGPLMAVQIHPHRVWGVRVGLDERRPPVGIEDVLVVVVDEHGLTIELEMRVRVIPAIPPTAPRERLLLRDAEHHHPERPSRSAFCMYGRATSSLTTPFANRTTGISCAFANALTSSA